MFWLIEFVEFKRKWVQKVFLFILDHGNLKQNSSDYGQCDPFVMDLALFGKWGFLVTIFTANFDDVISLVHYNVTHCYVTDPCYALRNSYFSFSFHFIPFWMPVIWNIAQPTCVTISQYFIQVSIWNLN